MFENAAGQWWRRRFQNCRCRLVDVIENIKSLRKGPLADHYRTSVAARRRACPAVSKLGKDKRLSYTGYFEDYQRTEAVVDTHLSGLRMPQFGKHMNWWLKCFGSLPSCEKPKSDKKGV